MTDQEKQDFSEKQKGNKNLQLRRRRRKYYQANKEQIKLNKLKKEEMVDKELIEDMMSDAEFMDWVNRMIPMSKVEEDRLIEIQAGFNPNHK